MELHLALFLYFVYLLLLSSLVFAENSTMLKRAVRNYQIGSTYYAAEGKLCTEQGSRTKVPIVAETSNRKQTILVEADYVTCTQ